MLEHVLREIDRRVHWCTKSLVEDDLVTAFVRNMDYIVVNDTQVRAIRKKRFSLNS